MAAKTSQFQISGLDCEDEVSALRAALQPVPGILEIDPNLLAGRLRVTHQEFVLETDIIRRIEATGLKVLRNQESVGHNGRARTWPIVASGVLLGSGLILSTGLFPIARWFLGALYLVSIVTGGLLVFPKAWRALRGLRLDMNVLMSVATVGALAIGQTSEAAAVVFLFGLAEWLEGFTLDRARRSIQALLKLVPETALVKNDSGQFTETLVTQVPVGAIIRVRSGSRIPLDGLVRQGTSAVNQAPITGESVLVEKKSGDLVLAGSINSEGSLEIEVAQAFQNTKLAQIIQLIEEAQKQKAPIQRFVDLFARYYTPTVFVGALLTLALPPLLFHAAWPVWIYRALVLLVIACPCALVIATPVSVVSGLTAMAKKGILIKGGAGLEAIGKIEVLAVDKTGTITEGVPKILGISVMNGSSDSDLLSIAASIDTHSTHPLARAVVAEAQSRKVPIRESVNYESVTGRGAQAVIDGHIYFVGNHRFTEEHAICSDELEALLAAIEERAQSVVVVGHRPHPGCAGEVLGVIAIGDAIRADARAAVRDLHAAGLKRVVMLSGDNQRTVSAISKQVGIDEAYGDLLPENKVLKIKELKATFPNIAMLGDGVNDAPAMASATIGIAMGASGTDAAVETADVTLMQDRLSGVADAIQMGKRTLRVIWFNTGFALATKGLFLILSIMGISTLWLAIAADTGATLFVIANALRLLR